MYVIKRTDQGKGYLAPSGSHNTYTHDLEKAKIFSTKEKAERDICPGNEIILSVDSILRPC